MRLSVVVVSVAAVAVVAGCSSVPSRPVDAGNGSTGSLTAAPAHRVVVRGDGQRLETLDVVSGASVLDVAAGPLSGALAVATTPAGSGQVPTLNAVGTGRLAVGLQSAASPAGGPAEVDVVLSPTVTWTIELDGGATTENIDLRHGHVTMVDLAAGVTRATVDLPAQPGTVTVNEAGGTSSLQVSMPHATATRLEVDGGASSVRIGQATYSGIGGHRVFTASTYATAPDRVNIVLQGGVSSVDLTS